MSGHVMPCWDCGENTWSTEPECVYCGTAINPLRSPVPTGQEVLGLERIVINAVLRFTTNNNDGGEN